MPLVNGNRRETDYGRLRCGPSIRPRCIATMINTRPQPAADDKPKEAKSPEELGKILSEAFVFVPYMTVKGRYQNEFWTNPGPIGQVVDDDEIAATIETKSKPSNQYSVNVPKDWADAIIDFGTAPQRFPTR